MFKLFKKPPEIPEELDFLADDKSDIEEPTEADDEEAQQEITVGSAGKQSAKSVWPRVLIGAVLFIGVAAGGYWALSFRDDPVPAEIPQGDIFASLGSVPGAAPPEAMTPATPKVESQTQTPPTVPAMPQSSPQQPKIEALASPGPKPETKQAASSEGMAGSFGMNPFVDLASLRGTATATSGLELPHIGANGSRALPDIPRPAVSPDLLPSPGEIKTPAGPAEAAAAAPTMNGLIKGADGNSIAIMGDGTVLSEGDTYKGDRRVTFIGGEGLSFDNGDSISFGGQKK